MPKEHLKEGWESYRQNVIHSEAPQTKLDECKMAFFGGAFYFMQLLMTKTDPGDEITEGDLKMMDEIEAELTAFAEATEKGFVPR